MKTRCSLFVRNCAPLCALITIAIMFQVQARAAETSGIEYSKLWGASGELWKPEGRLPDFSFAGYRRGEAEIPSRTVTHNLRDFGAKGDGVADDTAAFKKAIAAVNDGVILIPAGRYVITDIIEIRKPNLVLRGEDRDRTVLFFPKPLNDIRPNWGETTSGKPTSNYSWSGGFLWVKGSLGLQKLATVAKPAPRGSKTITLNSIAGLKAGDTIAVRQQDTPENTLAAHLYSDEPGDTKNLKGKTTTSLPARIVAVDEKTASITLDRPLRTDLRPEWKPAIHRHAPTVSEVGIENLTFEFPVTPYGGHFSELGYNPVALSGVAHCWIRSIRILNCDSGPMISADFCTIDDVLYETKRAPDKVRQGRGHHGIILGGNDNLFTRFDIRLQFEHDITMGACASGNVASCGRGEDMCFDHHRRAPYENLFSDIDIGAGTHAWRCGGGAALGLNCAARGTFWNVRSRKPLANPPAGFGPWSLNMVGLATDKPSIIPATDKPSIIPAIDSDARSRWFEVIAPEKLQPRNLQEAQRRLRMQKTKDVVATDTGCFP